MRNNYKKILLTFIMVMSIGSVAMAEIKTNIFAGGCFWCLEHDVKKIVGVIKVESGYTGGETINPTYENYSEGYHPHVEAVRVTYDTSKISYEKLLQKFWLLIDPFDDNGQFCDRGYQYRAAIFYGNETEKKAAEDSKFEIEAELRKATTMLILPEKTFYSAEEYHQDYADKNPVRYKYYRWNCGRDKRLQEVWGNRE